MLKFLAFILDLVVNNKKSIANCIFYLTKNLVEALNYKPEGRGFGSRYFHWNFSLT